MFNPVTPCMPNRLNSQPPITAPTIPQADVVQETFARFVDQLAADETRGLADRGRGRTRNGVHSRRIALPSAADITWIRVPEAASDASSRRR
jgi:hypothetical protein